MARRSLRPRAETLLSRKGTVGFPRILASLSVCTLRTAFRSSRGIGKVRLWVFFTLAGAALRRGWWEAPCAPLDAMLLGRIDYALRSGLIFARAATRSAPKWRSGLAPTPSSWI